MKKSHLQSIVLNKNTTHILKNVLQFSIYNQGNQNIEFMGKTIVPETEMYNPFIFSGASNTVIDLELKQLKFLSQDTSSNKALIFFQTLETC